MTTGRTITESNLFQKHPLCFIFLFIFFGHEFRGVVIVSQKIVGHVDMVPTVTVQCHITERIQDKTLQYR